MTDAPTAIIAGSGDLPRLLAEDRALSGGGYFVCAFEGGAPGWLGAHPHVVLPFEKPGALFAALRDAGMRRIVFAGGMTRPKLNPLRFDLTGVRLAPKVLKLLGKGDDEMLRGLMAIFEREGFEMVGAHELLDGLLAPSGAFAARAPDDADLADVARAAELATLVGQADVGQAAVVERGLCLGLETLQGTDALLAQVETTDAGLRPDRGAGVLCKLAKPEQDRRADLPAIGPETVRRAAAAGLGGIAVEAGAVIVLGLEETRAAADVAGLWLYGWSR